MIAEYREKVMLTKKKACLLYTSSGPYLKRKLELCINRFPLFYTYSMIDSIFVYAFPYKKAARLHSASFHVYIAGNNGRLRLHKRELRENIGKEHLCLFPFIISMIYFYDKLTVCKKK